MNYQTKTDLILPFRGNLMVSNGGRTAETNNHVRPPDQGPNSMQFAYDFRDEKTAIGQEKTLQQFTVYGQEVLAPAAGKVIQVIDGAIDVAIGERDRGVGVGNAIIIDHSSGEYGFLCHFKHNSIKVKVGDSLKPGQALGLCGNTGNTSQPHIHFHLQDGPLMHTADPLPAQFRHILVNGQLTKNHEPVRFDQVSNPKQ